MSERPIDNMLEKTMQKIKEMVDINTIIGDPIVVNNTSIIPISKVTYGFASGGSELPNNKKSEENNKKKIGYFLIERCGWTKIKISQVNISAVKIEAIKNIVDIKIPRSHS